MKARSSISQIWMSRQFRMICPLIGKRINGLRLYQAEGSEAAEKISGVLYPDDSSEEGKLLRIRQEYFLSAAAVGDIVREYESRHGNDFHYFARENCIQLNDTHPVFAIPELIRVLKTKGLSYRKAFKHCPKGFSIIPTIPFFRKLSNAGIKSCS